ncbi:protein phosphatase 1H-like [Centruroides sculpturatus]|uniref:protein phosphatase 1H-like n=1 Tax=Centruroides sculpturatus TaxID=218467 RepID=UPI000C6E1E62|nr:protein phosphatase 1H-like [Centruroides sculpturatus]
MKAVNYVQLDLIKIPTDSKFRHNLKSDIVPINSWPMKILKGNSPIFEDGLERDRPNIDYFIHYTIQPIGVCLEMLTDEGKDELIARDKQCYKMTGGCTAIVALFILGKLYVANAGDSRSVICQGNKVIPMSADFTPETEKERIKKLHDVRLVTVTIQIVDKSRLKAYKIITVDDLKFPLVYGEGKRSRALATIGVTRGFGDHDLKAQNSNLYIKPFLSPQPEIKIFDLGATELTDSDVLIMGTDGLWDITSNEKSAGVVQKSLDHFPANDMQRYKYR